MADHLVAWLYETPTAVLTPGPEFRITLEWRAEAVERWGAGSPALSVGLPIGAMIGPRDMRGLDFFENILPEEPTLQRMAAMAGVRPADTYGILKAFGRGCAGAIQVLPEGEEPGAGDGRGGGAGGAPEPTTAQVRAWARAHGITVPDRGRLRPDVWDAWRAAH